MVGSRTSGKNHHPLEKTSDPKPHNRALPYKLCINAPRDQNNTHSRFCSGYLFTPLNLMQPTQQLCPEYLLWSVQLLFTRVSSLSCCCNELHYLAEEPLLFYPPLERLQTSAFGHILVKSVLYKNKSCKDWEARFFFSVLHVDVRRRWGGVGLRPVNSLHFCFWLLFAGLRIGIGRRHACPCCKFLWFFINETSEKTLFCQVACCLQY